MRARAVGWLLIAALAAFAFGCTGLKDDSPGSGADLDADGGSRESEPIGEAGSAGRGGAAGTAVSAGSGGSESSGSASRAATAGGSEAAESDAGQRGPDAIDDAGNGDPADASVPTDAVAQCTGAACAACVAEPCLHGGACAPVSGGRKCTCVAPWFGDSCENNDDAALSALAVTAGTLWPAFDPEVTAYTVDLGFADSRIAVIPTVRVPEGASIRVEGQNLASGATSAAKSLAVNTSDGFSIVVASNTDTRLTYTVTVRRSLVQRAYVKYDGSKTDADLALGSSIAMDGERLVYGMPGGKYIDIANAGSVGVLLRAGRGFRQGAAISPPTPQAEARFGTRVALDGNYLAISAPSEDEGELVDVGAVYVFEYSATSGYKRVARLNQAGSTLPERNFGETIAIGGDVLAVSGNGQRVHMYRRIGGNWMSQGYLEWPADGFFGAALATDGTWLAVGGGGPDVQLYRYTPALTNPWQHQGTLLPDTTAENNFGSALAFRGDMLAVSSSYACWMGCNGLASAYTFARDGTAWNKVGRIEAQRPPDVPANAAPGWYGLYMAFDGRTVVTSAMAEPLVARGVFPSVPIAITEGASAVGAGYVYDTSGGGLELAAYLKASNAEGGDGFGTAVGVADGFIAIGAAGEDSSTGGVRSEAADDNAALDGGAIYIFGADCSLLAAGASVPGC